MSQVLTIRYQQNISFDSIQFWRRLEENDYFVKRPEDWDMDCLSLAGSPITGYGHEAQNRFCFFDTWYSVEGDLTLAPRTERLHIAGVLLPLLLKAIAACIESGTVIFHYTYRVLTPGNSREREEAYMLRKNTVSAPLPIWEPVTVRPGIPRNAVTAGVTAAIRDVENAMCNGRRDIEGFMLPSLFRATVLLGESLEAAKQLSTSPSAVDVSQPSRRRRNIQLD